MIFEYLSKDTAKSVVPFFRQYLHDCKFSYSEDNGVKRLTLYFQNSVVQIVIAECDENLILSHHGLDYYRSDISNMTPSEIVSDLSLFIRDIKIESII